MLDLKDEICELASRIVQYDEGRCYIQLQPDNIHSDEYCYTVANWKRRHGSTLGLPGGNMEMWKRTTHNTGLRHLNDNHAE